MFAKIIVIDDEVELGNMVKERLEADDYEVIIARDGREGLEKTKTEKPDLIILDIMMPGLDGFSVLSQLRANPDTSSIPVIMLTAKGETKSILKAQALHATDYLIKPFDSKELLRLINKYLSAR